MSEPLKCKRCGHPFVDAQFLDTHLFEHRREDQEKLDWEWEKQQAEEPQIRKEL